MVGKTSTCKSCDGKGKIKCPDPRCLQGHWPPQVMGTPTPVPCQTCGGAGIVKCSNCNGKGYVGK